MKAWIFAGHLRSGEAVYREKGGSRLALEKDHKYLVNVTPEETAEIYKTILNTRPVKEVKS